MMYWIYDYPSWAIGLLFVAVFVGVTWIGIFATRATVHSWVHRETRANDMVGLALSSFFVLFGLLLGLVAVATYQNFSSTADLVDKGASSITALYRDFGAYPQPIRDRLRDSLREYTRYTIEEGWPLMRRGIVPTGGTMRMTALSEILFAFEPSKRSEEIMHAEVLHEFNRLVELRRSQIANVTLGLPAALWWVVAFGHRTEGRIRTDRGAFRSFVHLRAQQAWRRDPPCERIDRIQSPPRAAPSAARERIPRLAISPVVGGGVERPVKHYLDLAAGYGDPCASRPGRRAGVGPRPIYFSDSRTRQSLSRGSQCRTGFHRARLSNFHKARGDPDTARAEMNAPTPPGNYWQQYV